MDGAFETAPRGPSCGTCRFRKVKCDRGKPKCTPCHRGSLTCTYSPKPGSARSRAYHEKEARRSQLISRNIIGERMNTTIGNISDTVSSTETYGTHNELSEDDDAVPESINRVSNGLVVHFYSGSSKFYSIGSAVGQVFEIEQYLRSRNGSAKLTALGLGNLCGGLFRNSLRDPVRVPVVHHYPPQSKVEQAMTSFFQQDYVQWPLYAEQSFRSLLRTFYQTPDSGKCPATAIGAWYISSEFLRLELSKLTSQDPTFNEIKQCLDESLSALDTACTYYASTPEQIKPSIFDVQVLTVASVTALNRGRNTDFRRILETACLLSKSIGLHLNTREAASGQSGEELWIFWYLYVLDKMSLVSGGDSCLLPSPNCGVPFPSKRSMTSPEVHHLRMAKIQLAGIHEQIYVDLYSVEASRRSEQQRQQSIRNVASDLQQWAASYLFSYTVSSSGIQATIASTLYSEVRYLYEHALCLIWRISVNSEDDQKLAEAARRGSGLVLDSLCAFNSNHIGREALEIFGLVNVSAAAPILTLFRFAMCNVVADSKKDILLLERLLENIISYVEYVGIVADTCDIVHLAIALGKELEQKQSSPTESSLSPRPNLTEAPWVSSSLAHIIGSTRSSPSNGISAAHKSESALSRDETMVSPFNTYSVGTLLLTPEVDANCLPQQTCISSENEFWPSTVLPGFQNSQLLNSSQPDHQEFGSAIGNDTIVDMDNLLSLDHGVTSEADWINSTR